MTSADGNQYQPDVVSAPGETLQEILEERGMSQAYLAERTGRPKKTINGIIKAKVAVTPETALQLERVLGVSASFWNSMECNYRAHLAQVEDRKKLEAQANWLSTLPLSQMIKRGWVKKHASRIDQTEEMLSWFGVASREQWHAVYATPQASFRRATVFDTDTGALAAWLRKGEQEAEKLSCGDFSAPTFRAALGTARSLTKLPLRELVPKLKALCANAGVAVCFVPQLPRAPVSGATCWMSPTKARLQLSLRYKTDDQFWFTFFHEAGHILLHGKKEVFLEVEEHVGREEEEANKFAADLLIPPVQYKRLRVSQRFSRQAIAHFADMVGIAAGIVVGRLQHDGALEHTHLNDLKRHYDWQEIE